MKRLSRQYTNGRHWLDVLPMVVIGLVCSVMVITVIQGFLGQSVPSASEVHANADLTHDTVYQDWYNDASGYDKALTEHKKTKKPIMVYFYAPWCGYCANFHKQIMSRPDTVAALKSYIKVRVYPDQTSEDNQRLMAAFGATGFPTLFVQSAKDSVYKQVNMYNRYGELVPSSQFIERLKFLSQ